MKPHLKSPSAEAEIYPIGSWYIQMKISSGWKEMLREGKSEYLEAKCVQSRSRHQKSLIMVTLLSLHGTNTFLSHTQDTPWISIRLSEWFQPPPFILKTGRPTPQTQCSSSCFFMWIPSPLCMWINLWNYRWMEGWKPLRLSSRFHTQKISCRVPLWKIYFFFPPHENPPSIFVKVWREVEGKLNYWLREIERWCVHPKVASSTPKRQTAN